MANKAKFKQNELLAIYKEALRDDAIEFCKQFADEDVSERLRDVEKIGNFSDLVYCLANFAWDAPAIMNFLIRNVVEEPYEYQDMPMSYDT